MSKGKGKAVSGGAGGGPSNKAAAGSSGQGSSSQGSSRLSASPAQPIGFRTEEAAVQEAAPPLAAEAAGDTQQTEPQPAGGGNTKKDKERQRKERQRQRKIEEAKEALQGAIEAMDETAGGVEAVEEAMLDAAKHEARSESLAALVAEAKGIVEQARAAEAERARVAAEEAAAAVAVKAAAAAAVKAAAEAAAAAKRQQMVAELAALDLRTKQLHSELGSGSGTSQLDAEETQCVVCFDAPKDHLVLPCKHLCVCEACAEQLTKTRTPTCPVCREPIRETMKVFCT